MRPARLVLLYAYFAGTYAFAAPETPAAEIAEATTPPPGVSFSYLELLPQASIVTPGNLVLRNSLFRVPYSDLNTGMPSLGIGLGVPLFTAGRFEFFAMAFANYRFKQGSIGVQDSEGNVRQDTLTLHWIPLSGGLKIAFEIPDFSYAKPTITLGAGTQWMSQSGSLSGISTNFWVPYAYLSPALTFLEARSANEWFGGFSFGTTVYRALTTDQTVEGLSLDLTVNIVL